MSTNYVAKALLFDQLTEASEFLTGVPDIALYLTREQLIASVHKELSDLFNSRTSFSNETLDRLANEVQGETLLAGVEGMMGLPELRNAFAEGGSDANELADRCARAIRLYEPRLQHPAVRVEKFDPQQQRLYLTIEGELAVGSFRENVAFRIAWNES